MSNVNNRHHIENICSGFNLDYIENNVRKAKEENSSLYESDIKSMSKVNFQGPIDDPTNPIIPKPKAQLGVFLKFLGEVTLKRLKEEEKEMKEKGELTAKEVQQIEQSSQAQTKSIEKSVEKTKAAHQKANVMKWITRGVEIALTVISIVCIVVGCICCPALAVVGAVLLVGTVMTMAATEGKLFQPNGPIEHLLISMGMSEQAAKSCTAIAGGIYIAIQVAIMLGITVATAGSTTPILIATCVCIACGTVASSLASYGVINCAIEAEHADESYSERTAKDKKEEQKASQICMYLSLGIAAAGMLVSLAQIAGSVASNIAQSIKNMLQKIMESIKDSAEELISSIEGSLNEVPENIEEGVENSEAVSTQEDTQVKTPSRLSKFNETIKKIQQSIEEDKRGEMIGKVVDVIADLIQTGGDVSTDVFKILQAKDQKNSEKALAAYEEMKKYIDISMQYASEIQKDTKISQESNKDTVNMFSTVLDQLSSAANNTTQRHPV